MYQGIPGANGQNWWENLERKMRKIHQVSLMIAEGMGSSNDGDNYVKEAGKLRCSGRDASLAILTCQQSLGHSESFKEIKGMYGDTQECLDFPSDLIRNDPAQNPFTLFIHEFCEFFVAMRLNLKKRFWSSSRQPLSSVFNQLDGTLKAPLRLVLSGIIRIESVSRPVYATKTLERDVRDNVPRYQLRNIDTIVFCASERSSPIHQHGDTLPELFKEPSAVIADNKYSLSAEVLLGTPGGPKLLVEKEFPVNVKRGAGAVLRTQTDGT
ncbi:hypothetical protein BJ742DRAFT_900037 [Cladochytrium replicatum]|nr:hypothetical protein BJ742DRAFT_900037 [Cladochytrium replicatum]